MSIRPDISNNKVKNDICCNFIKPNPEIKEEKGIDYYEHDDFSWLTYEEAMIVDKQQNKYVLRSFLVPALHQAKIWANKNI